MTPAARLQAAIDVIDMVVQGQDVEASLIRWGRHHRFAGSKDRAAIRDHVFAVMRRWRSAAALGGGETARARIIGTLRGVGSDPAPYFSGERYAPAPIAQEEAVARNFTSDAERLDIPQWLWPLWQESLGERAEETATLFQSRADIHVRVNTGKIKRETLIDLLSRQDIRAVPHPLAATALNIEDGARKLRNSPAFKEGLFEFQDAASQAAIAAIPEQRYENILDFCAGGGGKTLALAARFNAPIDAHDIAPNRMRDLPPRAQRAGAKIRIKTYQALRQNYDLIICDVPCSGSGAWRRQPAGKWRLTAQMLETLRLEQAQILQNAATKLRDGGCLTYITCSMLTPENRAQIDNLLQTQNTFKVQFERQFHPQDGGDGFYVAVMTKGH